MQANGYKPTPLDLSQVVLSEKMKDLVELLAENTHNVWAKERIKTGWTYGLHEVRLVNILILCKYNHYAATLPNCLGLRQFSEGQYLQFRQLVRSCSKKETYTFH